MRVYLLKNDCFLWYWYFILRYAICHATCGDTIVIGETPLAIMQGT